MSNADNRSVRRTRKALHESMIELMKSRSCLSILVKDICDTADVGRSTFYAHYQNQYELLREIEDQAFAGAMNIMEKYGIKERAEATKQDIAASYRELFEYIAGNSDSIQVLLGENGDPRFQRRFFLSSVERMRFMKKRMGDKSPDEKEIKYISLFGIGGFIMLVQEWLKSGMDMPIPEITEILARIASEGIINFYNGKKSKHNK